MNSEGLKFELWSLEFEVWKHRGLIKGRWVEKAGERERCFYRLTSEGRRVLVRQRDTWKAYVEAVNKVMEPAGA